MGLMEVDVEGEKEEEEDKVDERNEWIGLDWTGLDWIEYKRAGLTCHHRVCAERAVATSTLSAARTPSTSKGKQHSGFRSQLSQDTQISRWTFD